MDNIFTTAAKTYTTTENGHAAVNTTGSAVLDFYGQIGALRDADFERVKELFDEAVAEDPLLAIKALFYGRDARGGTGERELFRKLIRYAAGHYYNYIKPNLHLIPEYGRWDDVYALVGTPLEEDAASLIREQFIRDAIACKNNKPVSLLAKWLKSCNTSSAESRKLGEWTREMLGLNPRLYRKALSKLRSSICIVEKQMSANDWSNIAYDKLPSRAGLIYRDAFDRHDPERYAAYLETVRNGEAKMNAAMNTPQDIVHAYGNKREIDETLELMWKNLPDYVATDENIMVMADVSGSMYGRPMEISVGLAMYFAQHNRGAYHNLFMTFESNPSFVALDDNKSLLDNIRITEDAPWGGSTDLTKACRYMLAFAQEHNAPAKDMPRRLIIVSDMEIDEAQASYYDWRTKRYTRTQLHIDELRQMYEAAGYPMLQIIYWNVNSRHNHFQTKSDTPGVMLASGSSPAVFEALIAMKDLEVTPYDAMLAVLNGERYAPITIG